MEPNSQNRPIWMEDELVQNIDPKKLEFLSQLYKEGQGKNQKSMMSYMLPMMRKAKQENLTFTPQEMSAAINAIKKHSSKEELEKIDNMLDKGKPKKHT